MKKKIVKAGTLAASMALAPLSAHAQDTLLFVDKEGTNGLLMQTTSAEQTQLLKGHLVNNLQLTPIAITPNERLAARPVDAETLVIKNQLQHILGTKTDVKIVPVQRMELSTQNWGTH